MDRTNKDKYEYRDEKNSLYCFPDFSIENIDNYIKKREKNNEDMEFEMVVNNKKKNINEYNINNNTRVNFDKGYIEGEKAGFEEVRRKVEPVLKNFEEALKAIDDVKMKICQNAEKETIDLAIAIAKKIISQEITTNREVIINIIKNALKEIPNKDEIKIKLNPSDLEIVLKNKESIKNSLNKFESTIFIEDENIENGGCIIETNTGDFDARIKKQIEIIENAFDLEFNKFDE